MPGGAAEDGPIPRSFHQRFAQWKRRRGALLAGLIAGGALGIWASLRFVDRTTVGPFTASVALVVLALVAAYWSEHRHLARLTQDGSWEPGMASWDEPARGAVGATCTLHIQADAKPVSGYLSRRTKPWEGRAPVLFMAGPKRLIVARQDPVDFRTLRRT